MSALTFEENEHLNNYFKWKSFEADPNSDFDSINPKCD